MILGQLRIGARSTTYAALVQIFSTNLLGKMQTVTTAQSSIIFLIMLLYLLILHEINMHIRQVEPFYQTKNIPLKT